MNLLTKELRKALPPLYSQEKVKDPRVICTFFTPDAHWTWSVIEFDGTDLFFGYVVGDFSELRYFRLSELQEVRGRLGLTVERDRFFIPSRLSQMKAKAAA